MSTDYRFEWDPNKAKSNLKKHKVSFENAASVFKDKNAITIFDNEHSAFEDRWITIGLDSDTNVLIVVHTFTKPDADHVILRILSARKATNRETEVYFGE
jgi:uncharacterized protein